MPAKFKITMAIVLMGLSMLACSLPFGAATVIPASATPNGTLTALVETLTAFPPLPKVITATLRPSETPTQTATATQVPPTPTVTSTYTVVPPTALPQRSGAYVVAPYLYTAPTLDGNWDEWSTTEYSAGYVVYGSANRVNADDLDAAFRTGWDNQYLYIAVKVRDDHYVQNATGQDLYKGDSIEVLMDTDLYGDFYYNQLSADDYQLGISPGNPDTGGAKEAFLWFPRSISGSRPQVQIAATGGDGVYRVEAAIPWSVFGVLPYSGEHLGFALSVSDNDNPTSNVQESMVSNVPGRRLTNPTTWGELVLTK